MQEAVVTTGNRKMCEARVKSTQQNTFFTGRYPSCRPTSTGSVKTSKAKLEHG